MRGEEAPDVNAASRGPDARSRRVVGAWRRREVGNVTWARPSDFGSAERMGGGLRPAAPAIQSERPSGRLGP
eukprot:5819756-Pyramimonas_sp.AAC.1